MSRRLAFTLIESLVVMAIIVITMAIMFPSYLSAKEAAKVSACMANLYQGPRTENGRTGDITHCPYPQGDDDGAYQSVGPYDSTGTDAGTVVSYCVEHLKKGTTSRFEVPLSGKFPVLKHGGGVTTIPASAVTRWEKRAGKWVQVPETGELPIYPTIWHFPDSDFPK